MASEAGNAAAEASIQALGGYGYTREYMVEKIRRDVRITTIYEGTSEVLEMTIARDRWQLHLKTRGQHYLDEAAKLASLPVESGAPVAALALKSLAAVLERCRTGRLTRSQHVLLRLGELVAYAETAAATAVRAARALGGTQHPKSDARFAPPALAALARTFIREAGLKIATQGLALVIGGGAVTEQELPALEAAVLLPQLARAQFGLLADLDLAADAIYQRAHKPSAA